MKKLNYLVLLTIAATASIFTACKKDEATVKPKPTITVASPKDNDTVSTGNTYVLDFAVTAGEKLTKVTVDIKNGSTTYSAIDTTLKETANFKESGNVTAGAPGTEIVTITAVDKNGETATTTITVTVKAISTPMNKEKVGAFFHIQGSLKGAWDLVSDSAMSASNAEANKDMKNTDAAAATFTGSWTTGTGNDTKYVKANSYAYATATVEGAAAAFAAGTSNSSVSNPAANDIYIAKLRGGSNYAVIKIITVDPTNNDCNCNNKGKITFNYKK